MQNPVTRTGFIINWNCTTTGVTTTTARVHENLESIVHDIIWKNYQNNEDIYWSIIPDCYNIQIYSVEFATEDSYDFITIVDIDKTSQYSSYLK